MSETPEWFDLGLDDLLEALEARLDAGQIDAMRDWWVDVWNSRQGRYRPVETIRVRDGLL